jgi:hypothetical protein
MICCTTMANFNVSLFELESLLFSGLLVAADAAARGSASFPHMSAVPVVAGVACLDVVQLRRTALVR